MESAEQTGNDVAVIWVVVISWTVEVCGHGAMVSQAVFFSVVLAEFQSDYFS